MAQYLYTIPVLIMTVSCMLFLTATNECIASAHKKGFFIVFLGAFFITVCEVLSIQLDGSAPEHKFLLFLSNYLGFLLTPIMISFFAASIGRFHRSKIAVIGISAYFVVFNIAVFTNQLFFIDAQNTYHRGAWFPIYIISYILAVAHLLYETLRFSRKGFLQHKIFAYLLSVCFLLASSIQVFIPGVYTTRITVIIFLCVYYAYDIELANLFDRLTGVLNQGTYLRKIKELKMGQTVIILDIDDFKRINDSFGHQFGDQCLINIANTMKLSFGSQGLCYRIGGDEFAVVLRKSSDPEALSARFEKAITEKFKDSPYHLNISFGYSKCEKNDSIEDVIRRADGNMYDAKKRNKTLSAK